MSPFFSVCFRGGHRDYCYPACWSLLLETGGGDIPTLPSPSTVPSPKVRCFTVWHHGPFYGWMLRNTVQGSLGSKLLLGWMWCWNVEPDIFLVCDLSYQMLAVMRQIMMPSYNQGKKKDFGYSGQKTCCCSTTRARIHFLMQKMKFQF